MPASAASADRPVVTRFAPSPTGYLHIGGARTALFNWLYARGRGGRFLLRIEDTDRARSTPEATEAIFDGLRWLGLEWDGEAISQFSRVDRHREAAEALLASGGAYRCYASPAEIEAFREAARAAGKPPLFLSPWRDRGPADWPDAPYAVRLRAPREGIVEVDDLVQGEVRIPAETLDDLIILRSDGTPTYNFAVVVDDHDMGVTHIIRGDDHLTNAARQTLIYRALGWPTPEMAHVPLIHGEDGAKLSKRHGALGAHEYRAMGYLPEALRNHLARLGWSRGDTEIFTTEQALEWFDIKDVGRSAARFDFTRLQSLNGHYIREAEDGRLAELSLALAEERGAPVTDPKKRAMLLEAMPGLKTRVKTLVELLELAHYILGDRPFSPDANASKLLDETGRALLSRLTPRLADVSDWRAETLEAEVRAFAEAEGLKLGKVAQPLRAALTGRAQSPGVFDVLVTLGRDECLGRLSDLPV